ncbi:hypothetical protein VXS64_23395, partial [Escherichia coli]|nr:hypothetical protein [Escherichia coli]
MLAARAESAASVAWVAASRADVPASLADFFAAAVFCATTDALRATSSTISSKRRSASGRASSSVMAP